MEKTFKLTAGEQEVFDFLDELKDSGEKNMLDNLAHDIEDEFGYVREESKRLAKLWTEKNFGDEEETPNPMCKKYTDSEALPDEDDKCSLCGGDCAEE